MVSVKDKKYSVKHDKILIKMLERALENDVQLNKDKFPFKTTEVKYF